VSTTRRFRIAAIPADGVGKEVVAAGREVLDALAAGSSGAFAFDWQEFGWGCEYYAPATWAAPPPPRTSPRP
jgi:tartrate dehydrogenase/decarboxylase/D-malate dehydrogenase